jgi:hypothetical protein
MVAIPSDHLGLRVLITGFDYPHKHMAEVIE